MRKYVFLITIVFIFSYLLCSCTLLRKTLDMQSGFSSYLIEAESLIRKEDWKNAKTNIEIAQRTWKQLKPLLQIDIDHDYVNDIENNFTILKGYIESKEKSDSLITVLLLQELWKNIGQM